MAAIVAYLTILNGDSQKMFAEEHEFLKGSILVLDEDARWPNRGANPQTPSIPPSDVLVIRPKLEGGEQEDVVSASARCCLSCSTGVPKQKFKARPTFCLRVPSTLVPLPT